MFQVTLWPRHRNRIGISGVSMSLKSGFVLVSVCTMILSVTQRLLICLSCEAVKEPSVI